MQSVSYVFAALLFLSSLLLAVTFGSSENAVQASVSVACPFSVNMVASSGTYYILPLSSNVAFRYAVNTFMCSIGGMSGTFVLSNSTNTVYTQGMAYPPNNGVINVTPDHFANITSSYDGTLTFMENAVSNSITTSVWVVKPANITITNFSVSPSTVSSGSTITVSQTLVSTSFLAPTNIVLHTRIAGPFSFSSKKDSDLSTTGTFSFSLSSTTPAAGTYTVYDNVTYFDGALNRVSKNFSTTYNVVAVAPTPTAAANIPVVSGTGNTVITSNGAQQVLINIPSNSALGKINLVFQSGAGVSQFNITVANLTSAPSGTASLSNTYQYIQINESLYGSQSSIDPYLESATYNFSVDKSWVSQQGTSYDMIGLFKYVDGSWSALPTTYLGADSNDYFYSALTNSLSAYAVSFTPGSKPVSSGGGGVSVGVVTVLPAPPSAVGTASFTVLPIFSNLFLSKTGLSLIGLTNTGNYPIWLNTTAPEVGFGSVTLSSKAVYLLPGSSVSIQAAINVDPDAVPGSYTIPINFTVSAVGHKSTMRSIFSSVYISTSSAAPAAIPITVSFAPGTKQSSVEVDVVNPTNRTLYNSTVSLLLPIAVTDNTLNIVAYGAPSSTGTENGEYRLTWVVPKISDFSSYPLYYTIYNTTNPQFLTASLASFLAPSQPTASLDVFNISIPTVYTNSTAEITLSAIYIGSIAENITFTLSSPTSMKVPLPSQVVYALPNREISRVFTVNGVKSAGTYLLTLSIMGGGINQMYSVPLIVLPSNLGQAQVQQAPAYGADIMKYARWVAGAVTAGAIAFLLHSMRKRPKYHAERTKELIRIREQIKRSDEHA